MNDEVNGMITSGSNDTWKRVTKAVACFVAYKLELWASENQYDLDKTMMMSISWRAKVLFSIVMIWFQLCAPLKHFFTHWEQNCGDIQFWHMNNQDTSAVVMAQSRCSLEVCMARSPRTADATSQLTQQ